MGFMKDGSYYKQRNGRVVGPAKRVNLVTHPFRIGDLPYDDRGRWVGEDMESGTQYDLIAEVVWYEPTLLPPDRKVVVRFRDGTIGAGRVDAFEWKHRAMSGDIIGYITLADLEALGTGKPSPAAPQPDFNASGSKYLRAIRLTPSGLVDVYAVLRAFDVTCPARQHAIKKLLCAGLRGKGDVVQDLTEARDAVARAIEFEQPVPE